MATVFFLPSGMRAEIAPGATILDAARAAGATIEAPCAGAGTCGKCRVRIPADDLSLIRFRPGHRCTEAEEADGWLLACGAEPLADVTVQVPARVDEGLRIVSEGEGREVRIRSRFRKVCRDSGDVTEIRLDGHVVGTESGDTSEDLYGLAVDLGTTTLAASLVDFRTGETLATASNLNPQSSRAHDILSRIRIGSEPEGLATLHGLLREALADLTRQACAEAGVDPEHIYETVLSGNTGMMHLAAGISPATLGKYPYVPAIRGNETHPASAFGIPASPHGKAWFPPILSPYVGADITAGVVATRLSERDDTALLIDIGTNGELVLRSGGRLLATSAAAGPAFEGMNISCGMRASDGAVESFRIGRDGSVEVGIVGGAEAAGICGSGLVDVVGELVACGGIGADGRFAKPGSAGVPPEVARRLVLVDGKTAFRVAGGVTLSQKDIRQLQLAKGAMRAAIELLLSEAGIEAGSVDAVLVAGSFGYHLRTESLFNIGLLPRAFEGKVSFVGNTALSGSRMLLLDASLREAAIAFAGTVRAVESAGREGFDRLFVDCLAFPAGNPSACENNSGPGEINVDTRCGGV